VAQAVRDAKTHDAELDLLERSPFVAVLDECLADAVGGRGRFVLIAGEAGVGKSVLVQRFCEQRHGGARVLWGACDALHTPRPLGPFLDIAATTGGLLEEVAERGDRPQAVFAALLAELRSRKPTITVLEDVHWSDEATLDMLKLLGRRAESADALVIATYRDDELDPAHPLRVAVGELGTAAGVRRVQLPPLSLEAVRELAVPHAVDAEDLYRKTDGNPFFVTEVLAAGEAEIPPTVTDAVLARAGRLSASARRVLEAVAVVPPRIELWLLEALVSGEISHLEQCLGSGMLRREEDGVAFRHDLARLAIEDSISPHRRVLLHREALRTLRNPPRGNPDLARLAHHAEAAGDAEAVLEVAPAAAARAASLGAHREAAAQYARTLRFADGLPPDTRAELLERRSHECFLTDQYDEAIEALEHALECHRWLGDRRKEGDSLRSLSEMLWCPGRTAEGEEAARQAVALLETLPPGRELAMAYGRLSALCMNAEDAEEVRKWSARALELGQRLDDTEIVVRTLNDIGTMALLSGAPEGREKLERSLELAEEAGLEEHVGRAFNHLAWVAVRQRSHAFAGRYIQDGLDYCGEHGLDLFRLYLLAYRARSELDQGRWTEAVESAGLVLRVPRTSTTPRILALVTLGLVRARRGDPGPWAPLDEALALAEPTGELQRIAPVVAARAEASWLEGKHQVIAEATEVAFDLAARRLASWPIGELAYWRWRAGVREETPPGAVEPYALQIAGEWTRAAELWGEIGCPYEAALALADAADDDALCRALNELHLLGGRPAATIVARRLRERGARGLPRGPRPSTRQNPANLTPRELEVLALVSQGLRNVEIANRLFLSVKTVNHHVSAILRKLGVRTRGQASAEAVRLGLTGQDR
jgi:DNA-binding CsgD family transcriptional regulator/tetratricopeptide (TPR) repeat protein